MKLYSIRGYGRYCAGILIIAAKDESEARAQAKAARCPSVWMVDYSVSTEIKIIGQSPSVKILGKPRILEQFEYGE